MKLQLQSGRAIDYPKSPHDVTLSQFIRYNNEVVPTMPKDIVAYQQLLTELADIEKELDKYYKESGTKSPYALHDWLMSGNGRNNAKRFLPGILQRWRDNAHKREELQHVETNLWLAQNWHPYQLRVVRAITGVEDELTVDELQFLFGKCTAALQQPEHIDYKQLYYHDGITYSLPDNLMRNSTLIEFAEAAQYEAALKQAQGGDANGLLKMCAVLLKPIGEQYSEELFERNVLSFQTLSLQTAYEVSFFLSWLSAKYALNLNRSMLREAVEQLQN